MATKRTKASAASLTEPARPRLAARRDEDPSVPRWRVAADSTSCWSQSRPWVRARRIRRRLVASDWRPTRARARPTAAHRGKARNVAHVNAGADHAAALAHGLQGGRDQRAHRREDDRAIKRLGRTIAGGAGPDGAELPREILARDIA